MSVEGETTSLEEVVKPEAGSIRTAASSHHRSRRRQRMALRVALILAVGLIVWAASDFVYTAYQRVDCSQEYADPLTGSSHHVTSEDCM
jgi:hypothetical protein